MLLFVDVDIELVEIDFQKLDFVSGEGGINAPRVSISVTLSVQANDISSVDAHTAELIFYRFFRVRRGNASHSHITEALVDSLGIEIRLVDAPKEHEVAQLHFGI
jgi:hypothetical protein